MGLGYDDSCDLLVDGGSTRLAQVCDNIDGQDKSAAAVAVSVGGIFRLASREFIERSCGTTLYRSFQLYLWGSADAFEKDMAQAYHWVIRKPT